jgi:hypothetical protein
MISKNKNQQQDSMIAEQRQSTGRTCPWRRNEEESSGFDLAAAKKKGFTARRGRKKSWMVPSSRGMTLQRTQRESGAPETQRNRSGDLQTKKNQTFGAAQRENPGEATKKKGAEDWTVRSSRRSRDLTGS